MELKAEITDRVERRRRVTRRLWTGGAVALVAATAAIAVPLLTGTDEPAYAVSKKADGTVRVEINEFKDADQLERDLVEAGVRADISYVPVGKQCKVGRGQAGGQALAGGPGGGAAWMSDGGVDIDPRQIGEDQTLVLEFAGDGQETADTKNRRLLWRLTGQLITGPVAPCTLVDDPSWQETSEN
ncbi:hypothetical protein [Nonomuraea candida]|uniref:hypothetical protein n=1 Tax=Nonomuraea candida TaxID=359159 RepID=UPI0012F7CAE0|nr:hypothetical protein [Nonomuraea candida]